MEGPGSLSCLRGPTTSPTFLRRFHEGAESGDWNKFYSLYRPLILGFARRVGLQEADCEDVFQNVMQTLIRRLPTWQYEPRKGRFRAYLKTITVRAAFKVIRRNNRPLPIEAIEKTLLKVMRDPMEDIWRTEWDEYLIREGTAAARRKFSERIMAIYTAHFLEQEPAQDVAKAFGTTVNNVHKIKSRVLNYIRAYIKRLDNE